MTGHTFNDDKSWEQVFISSFTWKGNSMADSESWQSHRNQAILYFKVIRASISFANILSMLWATAWHTGCEIRGAALGRSPLMWIMDPG